MIFYALSSLGLKHPKQGIMKGPFTRRWGDSGSKINQRQTNKETHLCAKSLSFLSVLDSGSTHRVTLTPHLHGMGQKVYQLHASLTGIRYIFELVQDESDHVSTQTSKHDAHCSDRSDHKFI